MSLLNILSVFAGQVYYIILLLPCQFLNVKIFLFFLYISIFIFSANPIAADPCFCRIHFLSNKKPFRAERQFLLLVGLVATTILAVAPSELVLLAAFGTAGRFVSKPLLGVELLFPRREHEFLFAVPANKCLIDHVNRISFW